MTNPALMIYKIYVTYCEIAICFPLFQGSWTLSLTCITTVHIDKGYSKIFALKKNTGSYTLHHKLNKTIFPGAPVKWSRE